MESESETNFLNRVIFLHMIIGGYYAWFIIQIMLLVSYFN